ncbi:MAG: hemerythrin HHE cation binding domain-containing protein [Rhodospirillaceae bacterium]|uniref:hemerythrin domain-containing protein n=1 Tax=Desulfovibrio sp. TaxID=885 RepID=UPI0013A03F9A|nr:hemerythrin domain-containing protein [Desulfovibrio sp.]KAF0138098.1 MAG: hemerythrin HHE cation binding domain-containing protein [Rhodospirillaceae bacterium]HMM39413.1 hemerythrin domain-containing protein [Desulfovibrio sp.]
MTATDDLRSEHEGILRMLDILRAMAARISAGETVPPAQLKSILDFLKVFADKCHHGKEEDILFPALEEAGLPREGGPIGVMLHEHTLGRGHIRDMGTALETLPGAGQAGYAAFSAAALAYADLLTQHIAKENTVLFPMAERLLGVAALTDMHEPFERIEAERIGPGRHEAFHRLLDDLAAQYLAV